VVAFSVLGTTMSLSETREQRQACIGDAFQFCTSAIPSHDRVFACLADNRRRISPACRMVIAPYLPSYQQSRRKTMW